MNPIKTRFAAGVLLIFTVYFYFLIFAQFSFLELARSVDASESHIRQVMGAMAVGGLIGSFIVPLLEAAWARSLLRFAFLGSSVTAMVASKFHSHSQLLGLFIGLFVGIITVGVAVMLRELFTSKNWAWGAALGTGLAYFACNLPLIFQSSAGGQAMAAAVITLFAVGLVPGRGDARVPERHSGSTPGAIRGGWALTHYLIFFGILVWFDSAVFYIIQHSALKEATWGTGPALWRNAAIHLLAALLTGALIRRWGFPALLLSSFALLASGSIAVKHPELRSLAGWTYPAGVSVYSACLVAFPAFGPITTRRAQIAWVGAVLYAVSGWICSGLGIGMAQNLNEIPWQFVVVSAGLISIPFLWKAGSRLSRREISYAAGVLAAAAIANMLLPQAKATAPSKVERGRAIYIAEGCINCHSQFVRPHSADELLWGPYQPLETLTTNNPPLFGNRRQGPDLLNIGNRRSRAWLEFHFKAPRELSPGSSMPSYEHLFRDARGSALLDYLVSLKSDETRPVGDWRPDFDTVGRSDSGAVYQEHCAVCHGHSAAARPRFPAEFQRVPPDLFATNLTFAPTALPARVRVEQMARIIKFGLPGTDMPGHEYMPDQDVIALARYLEQRSRHQ